MQRTSLYNKLFEVVSRLKVARFENPTEYSEHLHKQRLDAFEMPSKGKKKEYCKPATIRKTISLAVKFGLISSDGFQLTSEGTAAARSAGSFKNILAAQVITYLDDKHFSIQHVVDTIDGIEPPALPDAGTIFENGKTPETTVEEPEFRKLLYLLYLCDRLDRQIRHLYFRK